MEMDPPNIETGWFKKILRTIGLSHSRVQQEPVLTVAATNIPESLDRALLRPGRFDRKINVAPPTDKYRGEVIDYYLKKVEHDPKISMSALVQRLVDYTPVAIKHVINEAVIIAHFDGRDKVTYRDLIEAQDVHEFGMRQTSELTPIDRRRLAYHEAGHAVTSYYLYDRYFPAYVTIHQRSDVEGAAAFALPRPKESIKTLSKEDIVARIQVALAARATEELFLDLNMNGVTSDLQQATTNAFAYVGLWGMDGTLASARVSEVPQTRLDERVENLLQAQFKAVKKLLKDHSEALIAVAEALITRDELVADEIKQLIDEADARQVTKEVLSDFEALLGNGHSNGKNGYALVGGNGNGNAPLIERPKAGSSPSTSPLTPNVLDKSALYNEAGEARSVELPFIDQKRRDL
jgi:ATP-dependent Zn protease